MGHYYSRLRVWYYGPYKDIITGLKLRRLRDPNIVTNAPSETPFISAGVKILNNVMMVPPRVVEPEESREEPGPVQEVSNAAPAEASNAAPAEASNEAPAEASNAAPAEVSNEAPAVAPRPTMSVPIEEFPDIDASTVLTEDKVAAFLVVADLQDFYGNTLMWWNNFLQSLNPASRNLLVTIVVCVKDREVLGDERTAEYYWVPHRPDNNRNKVNTIMNDAETSVATAVIVRGARVVKKVKRAQFRDLSQRDFNSW